MDIDKQLKSVEEFFTFTLSRIPDFDQKKDLDRPLNSVKIRKDILIRYNKLKGILDEDLWQTFSKRSIYILQALENLVADTDDADYDDESSDEEESSDDEDDDINKQVIKIAGNSMPKILVNTNSSDNGSDDEDMSDVEMSLSDDLDKSDHEDDDVLMSESNIFSKDINFNIQESSNNLKYSCHHEDDMTIKKKNYKLENSAASNKNNSTVNREELKRKLQEKISEQKSKRKKFEETTHKIKNSKNKRENKNTPIIESIPAPPAKITPSIQPETKFNKDKTIIYSKIEFPTQIKKKGKFKGLPRGRNYDQLLDMVEKEKKKIKELKVLDKTKADNFKNKMIWRKAMAKAEGVKIKDDENLLRRSLSRKHHKKYKGQKKWKEIEENVERKMKERQRKRKENISRKTEQKKKKKIKRRQKK